MFSSTNFQGMKTKLLLLLLSIALAIASIYFLWNKSQNDQCERLMSSRGLEVIGAVSKSESFSESFKKEAGNKVIYCIKKLYGIDLSKTNPNPFEKYIVK